MHDSKIFTRMPGPSQEKNAISMDKAPHQECQSHNSKQIFSGQRLLELDKTFPSKNRTTSRSQNSGFALVLTLLIMPFLIASLFGALVMFKVIQERRRLVHACQLDLSDGLRKTAISMQLIMRMNPLAKSLKIQYHALEVALAAALARADVLSASALKIKLQKVYTQRKLLHQQQITLYKKAETDLNFAQYKNYQKLNSQIFYLSKNKYQTVKPALYPDSSDIAPTWSLKQPFIDKQRLHQTWTWTLSPPKQLRNFIRINLRKDEKCSLSLDQKNDHWKIIFDT